MTKTDLYQIKHFGDLADDVVVRMQAAEVISGRSYSSLRRDKIDGHIEFVKIGSMVGITAGQLRALMQEVTA